MKPEHEEIIEAMARRYMKYTLDGALDQYEETFKESIKEGIKDMFEAAAEWGYRLAKTPSKQPEDAFISIDQCIAWNACLDAIETIELEESK